MARASIYTIVDGLLGQGARWGVACVWLPQLPLRVEVLRRPALDGLPLVLGGGPGERKIVQRCSPQAERAGIRPGLPLREVLPLCREAVVLQPDPVRVAGVLDQVAAALAESVSPSVEADGERVFLDLRGLETIHGGDPASLARAIRAVVPPLLLPRIAMADGKFAAAIAAQLEGVPDARPPAPSPRPEKRPADGRAGMVGGQAAAWASRPANGGLTPEHFDQPPPIAANQPPGVEPRLAAPTDPRAERALGANTWRAGATVGGGRPPKLGDGVAKQIVASAGDIATRSSDGSSRFVRSHDQETVVVPPGGTAAFLAPLSATLLPLDPPALERLELLGLRTIGAFAALPFGAVQAQLGPAGARAHRLATGQGDAPILPRRSVPTVRVSLRVDDPLASVDAIMIALDRLLDRAFANPLLRGRAARQGRLQALLSDGTSWEKLVTFKEPLSTRRAARRALRAKLDLPGGMPPAPVDELLLELTRLGGEAARQPSLFGKPARQFGHVAEAARQLRARYGTVPLYHAVEVEPWSRIPERRWALAPCDL